MDYTNMNDLSSISSSVSSLNYSPITSTHNFVPNFDFKMLNSLNSEFCDLGYESIYSLNKIDCNKLVNYSLDLVYRYRRQLTTIERIQEQNHVLDKENELFLRRQQNLKDSIENSSRELQLSHEKIRQFENKVSDSVKNIKILTEENRKLQHNLEQRDKQFKNDKKKTEKEIEKLKVKIQSLTSAKTKDLANIELSDPISKTGPRPTWNLDSNQSKKQLEMYSELIKDYDKKLKLIIIENSDLKSFMIKILSDLDNLLNQNSSKEEIDPTDNNQNKYDELINLSFDETFKSLNEEFQAKVKTLDYLIKNQKDTFSPREDTTLSSINSVSEAFNKTVLNSPKDNSRDLRAIRVNQEFMKKKIMSKNASISSSSLSSNTSNDSRKCQ